jgi:hypothetical protein
MSKCYIQHSLQYLFPFRNVQTVRNIIINSKIKNKNLIHFYKDIIKKKLGRYQSTNA